ncbi:uncharacterized protein KGF55_002087 [Candida pseudojiufengensis]|uniref:uncharacterized protein n=1 Tax=Candida pseudojiufengensis TaxID=497109 RepID=UPI002225144D|nr:uncharacterized protein KGF55_002087 [Candida pseudojiufengensis]KAI5964145.1 hypothetical protein KGF55_002087 [Candida pseudojiufengensis]
MRQNLPQGSPMSHKFIVGTIAILLGGYVTYKSGSDFQFVKFEPHSPEEIEKRKKEKFQTKMTFKDTTTLDLTPEAKERIMKKVKEKQAKELEKNHERDQGSN